MSNSDGTILVTGGAGYIGSHVVKLLGEKGENVVVLDDLSKGNREAVLYGEFVEGNTGDEALVTSVLEKHNITTVMHFAAHTIVPESVENPLKYYRNNTAATRTLLECCPFHLSPQLLRMFDPLLLERILSFLCFLFFLSFLTLHK